MRANPFPLRLTGAGPALALLPGPACTATKTPNIPAPVAPPTVTNADAKDYADYTELVWSDDFSGAGAPDAAKWAYDTSGGGWGNQEPETYTTSANNVFQNVQFFC